MHSQCTCFICSFYFYLVTYYILDKYVHNISELFLRNHLPFKIKTIIIVITLLKFKISHRSFIQLFFQYFKNRFIEKKQN